jgi:hypothetical protein
MMVLGTVLSFGIIEKKLFLTGPFNAETDSETSQALIIDLRSNVALPKLFSTGSDSSNNPQASTVRVFVNDVELSHPHSLHDLIRKEGGGVFSHWEDHLIFSMPQGIENSASTRLEVHFSLYLQPKLLELVLVAGLVVGGILLWQLYCRAPLAYARRVSGALLVLDYFLQWFLLFALLASILFLASTLAGGVSGYLLPNTAFFRWWPELNTLAMKEPFFGHAILAVAMVGAGAAWLAVTLDQQRHTFADLELRLVRGFSRYGFFFVVGLFLYSVGATWSGIPRPQDFGGSAIAGLLPFNDANGHFQHVYMQALDGAWDPFIARRPLAAAFRTVGVAGVDYNNFYFLLLQTLALATATFFAVRAVMAWRGVWAGLTFLGLTFILLRPYLPTNLTEPLGIFWALVSVPFLIRAIRFNRLVDVASGFHLTIFALMIRMGAMFTVPALGLWALVLRWGKPKSVLYVFFLLVGLLMINLALVSGLSKLYGTPDGALGSNFSTVICGLTHGTDWTGCGRIYANEIELGATESEQSSLLYAKAADKFLNEPDVLLVRLLEGGVHFAQGIWNQMLKGHGGSIPDVFPVELWWLMLFGGMIWVIRHRRERHELTFWLLFLAGFSASAPFVIFDDGWRVLSASLVVLSLLLASGFSSPLYQCVNEAEPREGLMQWYRSASLVFVAILCLVVPMVSFKYDQLGRLDIPQLELREDEELFLGTRRMSGFLVMPDGKSLPQQVPAIHETDFIRIIRNSGIEQHEALVTPVLIHQPPFAIVSAIPINKKTHGLLILPPEVFSVLDDRLWRFRLQVEPGNLWVKVLESIPVSE